MSQPSEALNEMKTNRQHKLTRQRRLVMETLQQSRKHLDAYELYQLVKGRDPRISLATVYRTLALLKEMGLVSEQRLGEEHGHFEMAPQTPHYHFTCQRCGRVIEFKLPDLTEVIQKMAEQQNLHIHQVQLMLIGICDHCLRKEQATTQEDLENPTPASGASSAGDPFGA